MATPPLSRLFADLNRAFGGPVGLRGLGYLYRPRYRDKRTREQKTSSVWWWDPPGKHPRVSTGCRDRQDAEAWRIQRLAELGRGSTIGLRARGLTFDDLCGMIEADYRAKGNRSLPELLRRLKPLRRAFGGRPASGLSDDDVTRYVASRRATAAVATINLELGHLRRMFRLARKKVPQECVPEIVMLKGAHVRHDVLEDADLAALLKHLAPHHAAAITGLAETGWREEEILGLEWARVSWEGQDIRLDEGDTKGGEARYLSFASHPALRALLERQEAVRRELQAEGSISPWVFPHKDGRRITKSALQWAWREARKLARIVAVEGPFIHGLRRKMCKELLDSGASEPDAMRVTGHKTAGVFRRYSIRDRAAQDRALAQRAAFRAAQPPTERSVVFLKRF